MYKRLIAVSVRVAIAPWWDPLHGQKGIHPSALPTSTNTVQVQIFGEGHLTDDACGLMAQSLWGSTYIAPWCYSSFTSSWYLSLFILASYSFALWYVFLRLDTYSDSPEFIELFFCWTLTRAVPFPLLPDGMIPFYSFLITLIMDSLVFRPILSYRTRILYYSSILPCSMEFYAYASPSISR